MNALEEILREKIITIIDEGVPYKLARRPYDEAFAKAHGITLADITSQRFIPCLSCGVDVSPMIMLGRFTSKPNVFCSKDCRTVHSFMRMKKIDSGTDVNKFAAALVAKGLDITMEAPVKRIRAGTKLETAALLLETNALLRDILKELKDGNRPA